MAHLHRNMFGYAAKVSAAMGDPQFPGLMSVRLGSKVLELTALDVCNLPKWVSSSAAKRRF